MKSNNDRSITHKEDNQSLSSKPVANIDRLPIPIENRILTIRGKQVMIDRDLAELYNVETKALNQAVKRNLDRFPNSFRFQLNNTEKEELVTNCDRLVGLRRLIFTMLELPINFVWMLLAIMLNIRV